MVLSLVLLLRLRLLLLIPLLPVGAAAAAADGREFAVSSSPLSSPLPTTLPTTTPILSLPTRQRTILLLDVDNTLYREKAHGIEAQLAARIHDFVAHELRLRDVQSWTALTAGGGSSSGSSNSSSSASASALADKWHVRYGSTVQGLRQELWNRVSGVDENEKLRSFYETVYATDSIDYSSLLLSPLPQLFTPPFTQQQQQQPTNLSRTGSSPWVTGYSHSDHPDSSSTTASHSNSDGTTDWLPPHTSATARKTEQLAVRRLLKSLHTHPNQSPQQHPITKNAVAAATATDQLELHLASNSPVRHVQTVVQALGLASIPWTRVWTPDRVRPTSWSSQEPGPPATRYTTTGMLYYPTKQHGTRHFLCADDDDCHVWPPTTTARVIVLDDSPTALQALSDDWTQRMTETDETVSLVSSSLPPSSFQPIRVHNDQQTTKTAAAAAAAAAAATATVESPPYLTLSQALGVAMGWTPPSTADDSDATHQYRFSEVDYLLAKNTVDFNSINRHVWMQTIDAVERLLRQSSNDPSASAGYDTDSTASTVKSSSSTSSSSSSLVIVDVGAGLLSMLQLVLFGHDPVETAVNGQLPRRRPPPPPGLPSLVQTLRHRRVWSQRHLTIDYFAYEPNRNLEAASLERLRNWGFEAVTGDTSDLIFVRNTPNSTSDDATAHELTALDHLPLTIRVHWRPRDYRTSPSPRQGIVDPDPSLSPHLIVGCCFADLLDPVDLVTSLLRCFMSHHSTDPFMNHTIVYFPITFAGTTQYLPPQPFQSIPSSSTVGSLPCIPSDTKAFALYAKALTESCGHSLDPFQIESTMADYGAVCVGRGSSNWIIDRQLHSYLWDTMLYFFGCVAAPEIQSQAWDARAWLDRAKQAEPAIHVSNVDLLFRMPRLGHWRFPTQKQTQNIDAHVKRDEYSADEGTYKEILFTGPRRVGAVRKVRGIELQTNEVRIQTECSLISSGTELTVFQGRFDDAALDTNIQDMVGERMSYPLAYGYSLVGRVVECGSAVPDAAALLGQRVFTFSAHASQVVTSHSAVQLVPNGIEALDAIFMPSVETALSLVQDARLVFGETVAVFGQGLIGLLVTALLQRHTIDDSAYFGTLSTFDTLPDRLAWSAAMGSSQALFPAEAKESMEFDVAIEVSGNGHALQSAIDSTRRGGRIVVGSWYGNEEIQLKLGIDFHRSHKIVKASQVSEIPTEMMKSWTKARRFALTWELVKSLKPSRLVTRKTTLDYAQEAYEALEKGDEIAVAFEYN